MRRALAALALVASGAAASIGLVWAEQSPVFVDKTSITISPATGGWTGSLDFTNLTDQVVSLTVATVNPPSPACTVTVDPTSLPAAKHTSVTVTVPAACSVGDSGITFTVDAGTASFTLSATKSPGGGPPDWNALWAFAAAFGAALIVSILILTARRQSPYGQLPYLDQTWSFSDSWVSNITVIGGLFTGIFGSSDVVKALGTDADSAVALATVGAAIAAALIAASGILVVASKWKNEITAGGLLVSCSLTVAGAAGELYTVFDGGRFLNLGGWQNRLAYPLAVSLLLLGVYAVRSMINILNQGTTRPPDPPPSDTITAATMIVTALKAQQAGDKGLFDAVLRGVPRGTLPATEAEATQMVATRENAARQSRKSRRTALL